MLCLRKLRLDLGRGALSGSGTIALLVVAASTAAGIPLKLDFFVRLHHNEPVAAE